MQENKVNFANHLTPRAMKIMDMVIQGLKSGAIAKKLELTVQYVSTIVHAPQFQHQLAIRRENYQENFDQALIEDEQDANQILRNSAKAAAEKMVALLDTGNSNIQLKASADIMDRVGPTKQTKNIDLSQTNIIVDVEMAKLIKETLDMDKPKVKQVESKELSPNEST